jgi:hypothetical protein
MESDSFDRDFYSDADSDTDIERRDESLRSAGGPKSRLLGVVD